MISFEFCSFTIEVCGCFERLSGHRSRSLANGCSHYKATLFDLLVFFDGKIQQAQDYTQFFIETQRSLGYDSITLNLILFVCITSLWHFSATRLLVLRMVVIRIQLKGKATTAKVIKPRQISRINDQKRIYDQNKSHTVCCFPFE